jgi:hypothetical protein
MAAPVVQAKLVLGPAGDRYEREADRVAAAVVGHPPSTRIPTASDIQQLHGAKGGTIDAPVAQALHRARGGGQLLPATLRWSMEQTLGADFGGVRVHTGARSDQLNRSMQAAAFTSGQDIFFRRDAHPLASPQGTALLAHELTHVVQQQNLPGGTVQRFFAPPANPYGNLPKPHRPLALGQQAPHLSGSPGWAISKEVVAANELLVPVGARAGHKVTRFTALLTPGHAKLSQGAPTRLGMNPLGWAWVERNEVRTPSGKLRYWVRFHLLNADLGGKGTRERHLVPTTKTANARWDVGLERSMAAALEGVGATPVYYDVQLTYWALGDAPTTYVDAASHTDYSANITLFPRSIEGNWQRYQNGHWVAQPRLTVNVDKPRGISGEDVELTTHANLKRLANLFHIDEGILDLLKRRPGHVHLTTYGDVRQILENWAMRGTTSREKSGRQQAIYESDGYLRNALSGLHSFKLKINNQHVPDDATPEAKMFGPAVDASNYLNLHMYKNMGGPITEAYQRAQSQQRGVVEHFPSFEKFVWLLTMANLYGVKLTAVQWQWDNFKATNQALPPMSDMHLVPDQDEVFVVLVRRTQAPVVQWLHETYSNRVRALTRQTGNVLVADELTHVVATNYGHLAQSAFPNLTVEQADVEHANNVGKLARALLAENPALPLATELEARLAAAPTVENLGLGRTLSSHPFFTTLASPMAAEMRQKIAAEQQRIADEQQRQAALARTVSQPQPTQPQPAQVQPTARSRIPADRPRSPHRSPPRASAGIVKPAATIHGDNQKFIETLRIVIRTDPRYPTDQAGQAQVQRRKKEVEHRWSKPERVSTHTLGEDIQAALKYIFGG